MSYTSKLTSVLPLSFRRGEIREGAVFAGYPTHR
jgi:hypothetical protein